MAIEDCIRLGDGSYFDVTAWVRRVVALGTSYPAGTEPEPIKLASGATYNLGHAIARLNAKDGKSPKLGGAQGVRIAFGPLYDMADLDARLRAQDSGPSCFLQAPTGQIMSRADGSPRDRWSFTDLLARILAILGGQAGNGGTGLGSPGSGGSGSTLTNPPGSTNPGGSGGTPGNGSTGGGSSGGGGVVTPPAGTITIPASLNSLDFGVYGGSDANPAAFLSWLGRRPTNFFVEAHNDKESRSSFSGAAGIDYNIGVAAPDSVNPSAVIRMQMPLWANVDMQAASTGAYDSDFYTWGANVLAHPKIAAQVAAGKKVRVRPLQEANDDYQTLTFWPWQYSNDPTKAGYFRLTFQRIVNQLKQAASDAGRAGVFEFVFSINACGKDWRPGYPGRSYVDYADFDIYQNNNGSFVGMSGAAEWEAQRTHVTGPQAFKDWATSENLPLSVSEFGIRQDGKADYVQAALTWMAANCVSVGLWNSNGAYAGLFTDGSYSQTAGEIRHMLNPAGYPVEVLNLPLAPSVVTRVGNGTVELSVFSNGSGSGGAITGWLLYKDGATTGTPISLTGGKYVLSAPNGTPVKIEIAAQNTAGIGFKSDAWTVTPSASASTLAAFNPSDAQAGLVFSDGNRAVTNPTAGYLFVRTTQVLPAGPSGFGVSWVTAGAPTGGLTASTAAEPIATIRQTATSVEYAGDSGALISSNGNISGAKAYFGKGSLTINTNTGSVLCEGFRAAPFTTTIAGLVRSDLVWGVHVPPGQTAVIGDPPAVAAPAVLTTFNPADAQAGLVFSNGNKTVNNPTAGWLLVRTVATLGPGLNSFACSWADNTKPTGGLTVSTGSEAIGTIRETATSLEYAGDSGGVITSNVNRSGGHAYTGRGSLVVNATTGAVQCNGLGVASFNTTVAGLARSDLVFGARISPGQTATIIDPATV